MNLNPPASLNPLGIIGIDHVKLYVEDAEKWARYHTETMGLDRLADGDDTTGLVGQKAILVGQGRIKFLFVEATGDSQEAAQIRRFIEKHGCGVRDIAFRVGDPVTAVNHAKKMGCAFVQELEQTDFLSTATIQAYGDTVHSFVHRESSNQFAPGYVDAPLTQKSKKTRFIMFDHIAANVKNMDEWVEFYQRVFGFQETARFDIRTRRSALMSKVVGDTQGYIRLPINEPSSSNSQVQEFLNEFNGAGVQHIALLSSNILETVSQMREKGVEFLEAPMAYYESLPQRVGEIKESLESVLQQGVLVDRDCDDGYLLQLFTQPLFNRPTLFYEIIQRHGNSAGFGAGNFQALFEAIEREQEKRGAL